LTAADARRAGAASVAALRQGLDRLHPDRPVYRIGLRYAGDDPRHALREAVPDAAEIDTIVAWLDRLDRASPTGPWTRAALLLIDELPATRAPDLAQRMGRDTPTFKQNVRKLKERGLTESLDIGYRLSARGAAVLDHEGHPRSTLGRPVPEPGIPLPHLGAAATRALTAHGVVRLEQVAELSEAEVHALHGVGPYALRQLRAAMDAARLAFRDDPATSPAGSTVGRFDLGEPALHGDGGAHDRGGGRGDAEGDADTRSNGDPGAVLRQLVVGDDHDRGAERPAQIRVVQ
jgi:hypothetical protein